MSALVAALCTGHQPDAAAVRIALTAAPHRGSSLAVTELGSCAIGVALRNGDGGVAREDDLVLAFAGVVDNIDEIRSDLAKREASARGAEPAQLLLHAWRQAGASLPRLLRGSYAVAVSDGHQLWYFRDHLGLGTLYSRQDGDCHWVASEAKQVVAGAGMTALPDLDVLETMFYGAEVDATGTAIAGVQRVPKARLVAVARNASTSTRYWEPERLLETASYAPAEIPERFDALMRRAVERVMHGDEVLALSGGIDSPTLAVFAGEIHARRFGRPLTAFSQLFPDYPSCDERQWIEVIVKHLGLELSTYAPHPRERSLVRLPELVQLFDGPWSGAWEPGMDEERYRRIRELGRTTMITGEFAEYVMDFRRHLLAHLVLHARFRAALGQVRDQYRRGSTRRSLVRQLVGAVLPGPVIAAYRRRNPRFPPTDWIEFSRIVRAVRSEVVSPRERWRRQQLAAFIGPGIAMEAFQTYQEVEGVRVRNPWGDIDLWEFFLRMPAEQKFPDARSKPLVRRLMRGRLPDAVLDRRDKTVLDEFVIAGFDYPSLRRWLIGQEYRMPGVDYEALRGHLERQDLTTFGYLWAKDLAGIHAFLSRWS